MRGFELVAVSVFLAAGVWVSSGNAAIEPDTMTTAAVSGTGEAYVMRAVESAAACTVEKGPEVASGLASVKIHNGCESVLPAVGRIRFWRDRDDGSVELIGEGAETVVTFAAGDGVEFESYRPVTPILSLSSRS